MIIVVAGLAVPSIVRGQVESRLTEALERRVTVESVAFDPFSLRLTLHKPDAQKSVATLSKALADRPALKLNIGGRADPAADREARRRAAVETAMKRAKMKSLVREGTAPASIK